jgi:hypothetical protein
VGSNLQPQKIIFQPLFGKMASDKLDCRKTCAMWEVGGLNNFWRKKKLKTFF